MLLIACPACARQYDVTGHDPGSEVRCACDERFTVPTRAPVEATTLGCGRCGGAIGPDDVACPYCEAAVPEAERRASTLCPGCSTRIADDSRHCRACGLAIAPQRLAPLPAERRCPRCAGTLRIRSTQTSDVVECAACLGIWITPESFRAVTARAARAGTADLALGVPIDELRPESLPDVARYIRCPACDEIMNRRQYRRGDRSSGVIIDHCRAHGVWLDHSELAAILEFVGSYAAPDAAPMPGLVAPPPPRAESPPIAIPSGPPEKDTLESVLDVVFGLLVALGRDRRRPW